ncbi:MAG: DMT family transporter [Aestuariivirgaceae bacterium]
MRPIDYFMGVLVALTWGMGIVFAKAAIDYFPPMLLMAIRSSITALALVWFVKPPNGSFGRIFLIVAISGTAQFSLTLTGLKYIDASVAALLIQLEVPFLVLLGALLLSEKPSPYKWAGMALAFVGVMMIVGEPRFNGAWLYLGMVAAGGLAWAFGQLLVRTLDGVEGTTVAAWVAICAAPQLFAMSAIFETDQVEAVMTAGWIVWAAVIYLSLIMTVLGYGMWYTLVRRYEVNKVAPFLLLLPLFSVAGSLLFLDETLTISTMLGGSIIVLGVYFTMRDTTAPVQSRQI